MKNAPQERAGLTRWAVVSCFSSRRFFREHICFDKFEDLRRNLQVGLWPRNLETILTTICPFCSIRSLFYQSLWYLSKNRCDSCECRSLFVIPIQSTQETLLYWKNAMLQPCICIYMGFTYVLLFTYINQILSLIGITVSTRKRRVFGRKDNSVFKRRCPGGRGFAWTHCNCRKRVSF